MAAHQLHRLEVGGSTPPSPIKAGSNTRDGGSSAARGNAGDYKHPVEFRLALSSFPLRRETVGSRLVIGVRQHCGSHAVAEESSGHLPVSRVRGPVESASRTSSVLFASKPVRCVGYSGTPTAGEPKHRGNRLPTRRAQLFALGGVDSDTHVASVVLKVWQLTGLNRCNSGPRAFGQHGGRPFDTDGRTHRLEQSPAASRIGERGRVFWIRIGGTEGRAYCPSAGVFDAGARKATGPRTPFSDRHRWQHRRLCVECDDHQRRAQRASRGGRPEKHNCASRRDRG